MNTFVDIIMGETESIISCVENVIHLTEDNDFVTNLLQTEEFEIIRTTAEELQTLVVDYENDYFSVSSEEFDEKSIQLYQECKYIVEALEESIQDTEVLNELYYIRAAVSIIRDKIVNS